jgi:DNA-binding NtrC family response regulator
VNTLPDLVILLVDDDPAILSALRRGITRGWAQWGAEARVHLCTLPSAGLGRLLTESVDIVIADYRMPEMDGIQFLRRARDLQPFSGRILLSGASDYNALLQAANQVGVARVLVKPWADEELVESLRQCVEMRRLLLENAELADQLRVQSGQMSSQEADARRQRFLQPEVTQVVFTPSHFGGLHSAAVPLRASHA